MDSFKRIRSKKHPPGLGQSNLRELTVLIASDWAPIRAFDPVIRDNPEAVYGDMLPLLRSADVRIVNCECALTKSLKPVWKSGAVFKGEPHHIGGLTLVPFDIACLANNHVFDYGLPGFRETLDVLRKNGIRSVGAGLSAEEARKPLTLSLNRTRISVVNFGEGEDLTAASRGPGVRGWEIEKLVSQIRDLKEGGDFVIAIAHAGLEYIPFPPPYVSNAFRALIDAGADCVVGHHPHVPQGIEIYKNRPIAYSLGNFVFFQPTSLYYRKIGFCLTARIVGNALSGFELHPYKITEEGIRRLEPGEERRFIKKISDISRPLSSSEGVRKAWLAYLSYYGIRGFRAEVQSILEKMESEPRKGAAMFRNRLTTLQHAELWRDALTFIMAEKSPPAPKSMFRVIDEWFTKTVDD